MYSWFKTNQAIGLYLTILAASLFAYLWFSPWAHRVMRDGFLLGFFPLLGGGAMLLCGLAMIIDPLRKEVPEHIKEFRITDILLPLAMLLGIALYFAVMRRIGFVLVTPVFLLAYMHWLGVRPVRFSLMLAVAISVVVYVAFSVLGVRLPHGILPPLR